MDQRTILYRNSQQTHDHGAIVGGCDPNTPSENVAWGNTQPVRGRGSRRLYPHVEAAEVGRLPSQS